MKVSELITAGMQTGCSPTAACSSCLCTQTITCMEPSHISHSKTRGRPLSCLLATLLWRCWLWYQLRSSLSWTQEQLQHSRLMMLVRGHKCWVEQSTAALRESHSESSCSPLGDHVMTASDHLSYCTIGTYIDQRGARVFSVH